MKKLILAVFIAILFSPKLATAQNWISDLTITPSVITPSSNVQVIANVSLPYGSCQFLYDSISVSGYTVDVYSHHFMGMATVICHATDTISVGSLQPGIYCLLFHLIGQNPTHTYTLDVDTICFTVDQLSGLTNYSQKGKGFEVYPNPITSDFNINPLLDSFSNFDVEIFNLYGQRLYSIKQTDSKTPINIFNFPNGTYILVVTDGDFKYRTKIIKCTL